MKRLRKRNADLVVLAKTLDERCKSLKLDNEKLVSVYTCSIMSLIQCYYNALNSTFVHIHACMM